MALLVLAAAAQVQAQAQEQEMYPTPYERAIPGDGAYQPSSGQTSSGPPITSPSGAYDSYQPSYGTPATGPSTGSPNGAAPAPAYGPPAPQPYDSVYGTSYDPYSPGMYEGGGQGGDIVRDVRVTGNQRIEGETVLSYVFLKSGDPFDQERMDRSLKELFATGLFADVTVSRESDVLVINVVENPIINRIIYEGNNRMDDEKLDEEVQLRPREVYTRTKVQNAVRRMLELYRRGGRFAATVEPKIIRLDQNRVDLIFEINEGDVTGVKKINFIGNKYFSDSTLRGAIATKESAWWRFLSSNDTYDPDRLAFDRESLRRYYLARGFADFHVVSAVAELAPDRSGFFITFTVDEGEPYNVGKVKVVSRVEDVDGQDLREAVTTLPGGGYDAEEVEITVENLTDVLGRYGYAFVDIRPSFDRRREDLVIDILYEINQAPKVYVERIDIEGNTSTLDRVIRREFRLAEGDAYNTGKIARSETRVRNLGFFDKVEVETEPGSEPDRTVVKVKVEEQPTGELSIGGGFSTSDGALGSFGVRERNFLGRGQDLRANFTISQRVQQIDFGFTEPYFLGRDIAAGIDLFRFEQDFQDEASFDQDSTGISFRFGYNLSEKFRHSLSYTLRRDKISDVLFTASRFIREQEGSRTTSSVSNTFLYDERDDRTDPTRGYYLSYSNTVAGAGGNVKYLRNEVLGGYYIPLGKGWVGSLEGRAGYVFGFAGDDVRINDRFYLGGDSFPGFEVGGVGPRDLFTNDSLGGNQLYKGTVSLQFPTGLPEEFGVDGILFTHVGTLKGLDDSGAEIVDTGSLRVTAGIGVKWDSPFGPVRIDFAQAAVKEDFDETEFFRISFGTRF